MNAAATGGYNGNSYNPHVPPTAEDFHHHLPVKIQILLYSVQYLLIIQSVAQAPCQKSVLYIGLKLQISSYCTPVGPVYLWHVTARVPTHALCWRVLECITNEMKNVESQMICSVLLKNWKSAVTHIFPRCHVRNIPSSAHTPCTDWTKLMLIGWLGGRWGWGLAQLPFQTDYPTRYRSACQSLATSFWCGSHPGHTYLFKATTSLID